MLGEKITIGAVCMLAEHDVSANMQKIIGFIESAAEEGVRLLVLPECCLQGYLWTWDWEDDVFRENEGQREYFHDMAEPIPGPSTDTIATYAAHHNMLIQIGMVEKIHMEGKNVLYNSAALIGPDGVMGVFRKVHSKEGLLFQGGREFLAFDTFVGKIGPIICWDLRFPESVRVLTLKGAEIITMSTAWPMDSRTDYIGYMYDLLGKANALMNGVWIVMSNQVGLPKKSKERYFGHSRIIDPEGNVIAGIGYEEGIVTARVNIKERINPERFRYRHPECYKTICQ